MAFLGPESVQEVVQQHARRLYRAARGMGFSVSDADDLTQEVFVTFLQTIEKFEGRSEVGTWLVGILHHKVQERRRGHGREELTDSVKDLFERRFNPDGYWNQPPVPAD